MTEINRPLRLLRVTRLSRVGEDSTGIAKQDEQAEQYAAAFGHVIVDTAQDAGVSGDTDPFARPALGPWLADPVKIGQYDGLLASHLDRLGRSVRYLAKLKEWAVQHGKVLIVVEPHMRYPFPPDDFGSRVLWAMLELLAEWELDSIKRRSRQTRAKLERENKATGKPPWGFVLVPAGEGKVLAPDPRREAYLTRMVEMAMDPALAGRRYPAIGEWLDSLPDPAARPRHGGKWSEKSISQVLRNPSLKGRRMSEDRGRTWHVHEGVITPQRWDELQRLLDSSPKRRGPTRRDPALLTDVAFCALCRGVLHARHPRQRARKDGSRLQRHVYRCDGKPGARSTCKNMIDMAWLDSWASHWVLSNFGDRLVEEEILIPADDRADEVAEIDRRIRSLDIDSPSYSADHDALMAERRALREAGAQPARVERRKTEVAVAALWSALDTGQRRGYLRAAGVRVYAHSRGDVWAEGDPARVGATLATLRAA